MKKLLCLFSGLFSLCNLFAAEDIRFIELGWDFLTSDSAVKNIAAVEKSPMDGAGIQMIGVNDKQESYYLTWLHTDAIKKFEHFTGAIGKLKNTGSQKISNSFVQAGVNPGRMDIFDDAAWEKVILNYRTAAKVAKATGMRGIILDPEAYVAGANQFAYSHQPEKGKHSYAGYLQKARERGKAVMQAIASEFPDMDLLVLYMYCFNYRDHKPGAESRNTLNSFTAAFFDGMIEAAPETMNIFDGQESSYDFNSALDFACGKILSVKGVLPHVAPDVREKYRRMVKYAPAIYLDRYLPADLFKSPHDLRGIKPAARLLMNLMAARRVADGYIWVYNERFRWWNTHSRAVSKKYWQEVIPGCDTAFNIARNPEKFAQNLIASGQMVKQDNLIADWKKFENFHHPSWQDANAVKTGANGIEISKAWGKAGAKYSFDVTPGEVYFTTADVSVKGLGYPAIRVFFYRGKNRLYTISGADEIITGQVNGKLASMIVVPDDADRMEAVFCGEAQDMHSNTDRIIFTDVQIKKFAL